MMHFVSTCEHTTTEVVEVFEEDHAGRGDLLVVNGTQTIRRCRTCGHEWRNWVACR